LTAPPCAAPALSVQIRPGRSGEAARYHIAATNTATPWHTLANLQQLDAFLAGLGVNAGAAGNGLRDLALVELPAPAAPIDPTLRDTFVILLSGDGGWANIDKDIGEALNAHGLPVVGWNSLQYFWQEKSPQQAGADLARTIVHYQQTWRRPRVLLIGFSLGADVLPFMINRLPAAQRAAIVDTVFLGLAAQVDFQFHVANWLGGNSSTARPLAPELAKLQGLPMLCIYGTDDDETICSSKPAGMETIALPGDHHFDGDYPRATQLILDHLHRRTAP
jgi:type IV secretory pathway VirJ component